MIYATGKEIRPTIELVVAHYNEDLSWLAPYAHNTTIYTKAPGHWPFFSDSQPHSPSSNASASSSRSSLDNLTPTSSTPQFKSVHTLPNIGRETHSYLTHIVQNYDNLAKNTIFLQGDIYSENDGTPAHTDVSLPEIIQHSSSLKPKQIYPIGRIRSFSDWPRIPFETDGTGYLERRGKTLKRTTLSPAQFWEYIFQPQDSVEMLPHPKSIRFIQGACFGVPREAIHRRPREVYGRILTYFDDLNEMNPEEGHFMERFWLALLCPEMITDLSVEDCPDGMVWRAGAWP